MMPQEQTQFSTELYNQQLRQLWNAGGWKALQQCGVVDYGSQANCYQMNGCTYYGQPPEGSRLTRPTYFPTTAARASTGSNKAAPKADAKAAEVSAANLTSANFSGASTRLNNLSVSK